VSDPFQGRDPFQAPGSNGDRRPAPSIDDIGKTLARISSSEAMPSRKEMVKLLGEVGRSARGAGTKAVMSGYWLTDVVQSAAAHIPARDLATLQEHHHGLSGPLLADALIRNASMATAAVGAATGALAAASQLTPATWTTLPFELLGETAIVVAIELKLVAELHAVAGQPLIGRSPSELGIALAKAWSASRGIKTIDLLGTSAADIVGRQARGQLTRQLRRRLVARTGRSLGSFAPFLVGAGAGAALNRKATLSVGQKVAESLGLPVPR